MCCPVRPGPSGWACAQKGANVVVKSVAFSLVPDFLDLKPGVS